MSSKKYVLPILEINFEKEPANSYPCILYKIYTKTEEVKLAMHLFKHNSKIITKKWLQENELISCTASVNNIEELNNLDEVIKALFKTEENIEEVNRKRRYIVVTEEELGDLAEMIKRQISGIGNMVREGRMEFICNELSK